MSKSYAVVTGASSGIGAGYARYLAKHGSDLLLVARRQEQLEALSSSLRTEHGVKVDTLCADLADASGLEEVEREIAGSSVTMLVNNAGAGGLGPTAAKGVEVQQRLIDLNVTALARLSLAALQGFRERNAGSLVNISSVVAYSPSAGGASYSASKAFVLNFTRSLQIEYQATPIRIQVVMPGPVRTEFFAAQGMDDSVFPSSAYISVEALVAAAMKGLDAGEVLTVPTLKDPDTWEQMEQLRKRFLADVVGGEVAMRYNVR